jgi:hypothetical protein
MPKGTAKVPGISNAGAGKPGYCKLCDLEDGTIQNQLDDRVRQKWSPKQLNTWLTRQIPGWAGVSENTVYKHRPHVQHPQDKLVSAVKRAEQRAVTVAPQSSPDEFLNALVSIGMQKAVENPEDVTIDHALRAASIQKQAKAAPNAGINVLIALMTNNSAPVMDGEYVDVTEAS